jgi:ATP:ADP antiporter, AAA family
MVFRLRRFLDVRAGEGLPVLLSFLHVACVVAAFLLAKPIRNALYLREYGPYPLVYAYAVVPMVLWAFVPAYNALVGRIGARRATIGSLTFFSLNAVAFWAAFHWWPFDLLPAILYVWVNAFGVIVSVQAWSFANTLFDVRQARRLFGLVGAGASLGAISGGCWPVTWWGRSVAR